jgi:hypothetical protein
VVNSRLKSIMMASEKTKINQPMTAWGNPAAGPEPLDSRASKTAAKLESALQSSSRQ